MIVLTDVSNHFELDCGSPSNIMRDIAIRPCTLTDLRSALHTAVANDVPIFGDFWWRDGRYIYPTWVAALYAVIGHSSLRRGWPRTTPTLPHGAIGPDDTAILVGPQPHLIIIENSNGTFRPDGTRPPPTRDEDWIFNEMQLSGQTLEMSALGR